VYTVLTQGGVLRTMQEEINERRKSVHYRFPIYVIQKLRKLAEKRGTTMTGVLIELIVRAKL